MRNPVPSAPSPILHSLPAPVVLVALPWTAPASLNRPTSCGQEPDPVPYISGEISEVSRKNHSPPATYNLPDNTAFLDTRMCCWLIDNLLSKRTPKIPWPNFLENVFHFIFDGKKVVCNECFVRFCYRVSGLPSQGTLWKSKPNKACLSAGCLLDHFLYVFFFFLSLSFSLLRLSFYVSTHPGTCYGNPPLNLLHGCMWGEPGVDSEVRSLSLCLQ